MKSCCEVAGMFQRVCLDCNKPKRSAVPKPKNLCAKTRPKSNPYETWVSRDGSWTWQVLKKWQTSDDMPYARWFCNVITPYVPEGEMGDVYVSEIKANASRVK